MIVFLARGDGRGHVFRSLSIARWLPEDTTIVATSVWPKVERPVWFRPFAWQEALERLQPDVVVIDALPHLYRPLPDGVPLVLVARHLRPEWQPDLTPFALVLAAEPCWARGEDVWPLLHHPCPPVDKGVAGYNLFWEAAAAGREIEWSSWTSRYDDQQWRVRTFAGVVPPPDRSREAAELVASL